MRPGEEEDHGGRTFRFGGLDRGEDAFEVVDTNSGDGILVLGGMFEQAKGAILGKIVGRSTRGGWVGHVEDFRYGRDARAEDGLRRGR